MALNVRLFGRSLLSCHGLRPVFAYHVRPVVMQPRPAEVPIEEGHHERNMRLRRPQSPHITIYKFPLPANLSITHRFTGIALSGYASTLAIVSILSNKPMGEVVQNISQCYPNFFLIFKFGLIFPFTYHFFNGIRHLIWDTGKALSLKGVYMTGYAILLCTFLSSGALMYLAAEEKRIAQEILQRKRAEEARIRAEEARKKAEEEKKKKKKKRKLF